MPKRSSQALRKRFIIYASNKGTYQFLHSRTLVDVIVFVLLVNVQNFNILAGLCIEGLHRL